MDRRTKYTKNVIKQALHACLDRHKLNDITIKELCQEADINRATFYRHYKDIYDLFDQIGQEFFQEIISRSPGREMTMKLLELTKNYQSFHKELYANHMHKPYVIAARDAVCDMLMEIENIDVDHHSHHFEHQYNHYNHGVMGLLKLWLDNDCQESTEVLCQSIMLIIENQYPTLGSLASNSEKQ